MMNTRLNGFTIALLLAIGMAGPALDAQRAVKCREKLAGGSIVRIADASEPGVRMTIAGRVVQGPTREPVADARVYAFHTDAEGYYSDGGMDESDPRLCGVARTGSDGAYRFETIRPAHYASGGPPAHVHFEVDLPDGRSDLMSLQFEGDPLLRGRPAGAVWETVRPLESGPSGTLSVLRDLWVR